MSKNTPKQGSFENFLKQKVNLGSWKTGRDNGKSPGQSWNLKSSKGSNPG